VDSLGQEVNDTVLTVDDGLLLLYALALDSAGTFLWVVPVTWDIISSAPIGTLSSRLGLATSLGLDRIGTGQIIADFGAGLRDTTGIITVSPGRAVSLTISPTAGSITTKQTLTFTVTGQDRYDNPTPDMGILEWSAEGGLSGTFHPNSSTGSATTVFTPENSGKGRIIVYSRTYSISDTTDTIIVIPAVDLADLPLVSDVSFYPNPFFLQDKKQIREFTVEYTLKQNARVTIGVFTLYGAPVKRFSYSAGHPVGGKSGVRQVTWDGTNANGRFVGSGSYLVRLTAEFGNEQKTVQKKVAVKNKIK
jgi:hypothetical protein